MNKQNKEEDERCDRCGKRYSTVYQVSDQVWQNLHMRAPDGLLCPTCCDSVVKDLGSVLYWEAEPGQFPTEKAKAEIERLWERMRWLGEVGRPAHPDDERPWIPAYLDAREALKKAETETELLRLEIERASAAMLDVQQDCVKAKARVREAVAETIEEAKHLAYDVIGNSLSLAEAYCERLDEIMNEKILREEGGT